MFTARNMEMKPKVRIGTWEYSMYLLLMGEKFREDIIGKVKSPVNKVMTINQITERETQTH